MVAKYQRIMNELNLNLPRITVAVIVCLASDSHEAHYFLYGSRVSN